MRRGSPERRPIPPDMRYNSVQIQTMVQHVMKRGKKSTALRVIYGAMDLVKERTQKNPIEVFDAALKNVSPAMEVRPRRVGGATYQVPMEIREDRRMALALRWLIQSARKRPGKSMAEKLAGELMDAYQNQGSTVKKKEDTHKMAEANRAFAHYRW